MFKIDIIDAREVVLEGAELHLGVQARLAVDVVDDLLVVEELAVPLVLRVVPEVVAQGDEHRVRLVEAGLLAPLV